jgi:excinuclease ABC subunit A
MREIGAHNLRIEQLDLPLRGITGISGVSGSGKSTLVDTVITRNWKRHKGLQVEDVGAVGSIEGFGAFDEVVLVGQEPLGRSTRSNAVSFIKVLPRIRELLASSPEAAARGLKARDFSFNVSGGRCETCRGLGSVVLEMHFLPDVEVTCEVCKGRRFKQEVLEVTYRGRSIQSILELTADEASAIFKDHQEIITRLRPLQEVGLGYLRLGQATSTLSGGEAQRLKLAAFLAEGGRRNRRLIIFDEPTTGLHARDVARLLQALRALTARGDGVLVVEHHLDFLNACDWIVDLGPGAGEDGGRVVYEGPVEGILRCAASITGKALAAHLGKRPIRATAKRAKPKRAGSEAEPVAAEPASSRRLTRSRR